MFEFGALLVFVLCAVAALILVAAAVARLLIGGRSHEVACSLVAGATILQVVGGFLCGG
jgi:hypothetical protein